MSDVCSLCERTGVFLTDHHLIPRQKHNKKYKRDHGAAVKDTVDMCRSCQNQIHALFNNKELAEQYNTIEALKAHEDVQRWIKWIKKR